MSARAYVLSARLLILWGALRLLLAVNRTLPKVLWRRWYDDLSELTDLIFGDVPFMNYGFAGTAIPLDDEEEPHRFQIQLYHEVATAGGTRSLRGLHVLEVGCGRGGGASYVARCLQPAAVEAIDLSQAAISSCSHRYTSIPRLHFRHGDAQRLPFDDETFDLVLNIETSHCYPDFPRFLAEVTRVLKPGGIMHLADFRRPERVNEWLDDIDASGLQRIETESLTAGVVAALEQDDARKRQAVDRSDILPFLKNALRQFIGCRGSTIHENFASARRVYLRMMMRKTEKTGPQGTGSAGGKNFITSC